MRKLSDNVKEIYAFRLKEKQNWINTLKNHINVNHSSDPMSTVAACFGGFQMVSDPHMHLDLTIRLAEWLEKHYVFFVPNPFVYRYSIPNKYGGYGGYGKEYEYVSMKYNLCGIESFDKIKKNLVWLMERMKYMSIQSISVEEKIVNNDRHEELYVYGVDFNTEWSPLKYRKNWLKQ